MPEPRDLDEEVKQMARDYLDHRTRRVALFYLGPRPAVRCRQGHLFTTTWIWGGSLKAVRLGTARFQRCPVGNHWSLVRRVSYAEMSDEEVRRLAAEHRDVPILFVTGRTDLKSRVAAFEAGADDYLAKPLVPEELLARVRVRLDRRRLMREMTERDPLTRLLSRRALLDALASRLSEARRHALVLSLAILDVDRFKRVNDAYGHLVGDQVLVSLGRLLDARFRLEDLRGRWGGEEFMVVFPGETAPTAAGVLSRVLDEFRAIRFRSESGEPFHVTFSAGIASFPRDGASVDALVRAADRRLYEGKSGGRGVVIAPSAG